MQRPFMAHCADHSTAWHLASVFGKKSGSVYTFHFLLLLPESFGQIPYRQEQILILLNLLAEQL